MAKSIKSKIAIFTILCMALLACQPLTLISYADEDVSSFYIWAHQWQNEQEGGVYGASTKYGGNWGYGSMIFLGANDDVVYTSSLFDGKTVDINAENVYYTNAAAAYAEVTYIENGNTVTTNPILYYGSAETGRANYPELNTGDVYSAYIGRYTNVQSVRVFALENETEVRGISVTYVTDPNATPVPTATPTPAPTPDGAYKVGDTFTMYARDSYSNAGANDMYGESYAVDVDENGNDELYNASVEHYGGGGWDMETYSGTENINLYTGLSKIGQGALYVLNSKATGFNITAYARFIPDAHKAYYSALVTYDGGKTDNVLIYDSSETFTHNGETWEGWGHIADVKIGTYPNLESVKIYISGNDYWDPYGSMYATSYYIDSEITGEETFAELVEKGEDFVIAKDYNLDNETYDLDGITVNLNGFALKNGIINTNGGAVIINGTETKGSSIVFDANGKISTNTSNTVYLTKGNSQGFMVAKNLSEGTPVVSFNINAESYGSEIVAFDDGISSLSGTVVFGISVNNVPDGIELTISEI